MIPQAIAISVVASFGLPGANAIFAMNQSTLAVETRADGRGARNAVLFVDLSGNMIEERTIGMWDSMAGVSSEGQAVIQAERNFWSIALDAGNPYPPLPALSRASVAGAWTIMPSYDHLLVYRGRSLAGVVRDVGYLDYYFVGDSGPLFLFRSSNGIDLETYGSGGELRKSIALTSAVRGVAIELLDSIPSAACMNANDAYEILGMRYGVNSQPSVPVLSYDGVSPGSSSSGRGVYLCHVGLSDGKVVPLAQLVLESGAAQAISSIQLRDQVAVIDEGKIAVLVGRRVYVLRLDRRAL